MNAVDSHQVSRRYLRSWALRNCSLAIPAGRVTALVGPNGAGKTTLLNLAAGLLRPTSGQLTVLDGLAPGSDAARAGIGFVAQDAPLYRHLPAGAMLRIAANLNPGWDDERATSRLAKVGIPLTKKVGALSGGQRAQLALTIALAKRPRMLILDEPLASLDPLARHDFMASLMSAVAEDELTVVFSSHVITELERIADYLVVLNQGRLQVAGAVDELLARHRILVGGDGQELDASRFTVVQASVAGAQSSLLVRMTASGEFGPPGWLSHPATLEELVLGYLRDPEAGTLPELALAASMPGRPE
jgi:ABC-2 type transport system ATP-binding protein